MSWRERIRGPVYLDMATLAKKLSYADGDAAKAWVERRGLPVFYRSQKVVTVRESDVDAAMEGRAFP